MALTVITFMLAALALGVAGAAWSGRWHNWPERIVWGPSPITLVPGVGVALLATALNRVKVFSAQSPLALIAFMVLLAGVILMLWRPSWWGPRWYRERPDKGKPDLSDPLTAAAYGYGVRKSLGPHSSAAQVASRFSGTRRLARWRGNWLSGGSSGGRESRADLRNGHIHLYDEGLAFSASDLEDRLRQHAVVLALHRDDIEGARVVPRGAGADGRRRPADGTRSLFPRLAVDTRDAVYLFEVNFAKQKAHQINENLVAASTRADPPSSHPRHPSAAGS